jgi:PilZ domain-containing protein
VPARAPRDHAQMPDLRAGPRVRLSCACTLHRRTGSPIEGRTLDVGPGGMRVTTTRPLATDEVLHFDLPLPRGGVDGDARVLREQGYRIYAMRFESLLEPARERLTGVAA